MDKSGINEGTEPAPTGERTSLGEIARVFLKLGLIGFGGPAAHIGLMEHEFVRRRRWVTEEKFADLLAAANLIPGPNSTELAIYLGQLRRGVPGLLVAGTCFILPAMVLVMALSWSYQHYGKLPEIAALFYGVKPVMIAIILQALWNLGRRTVKTGWRAGLGIGVAVLGFLGVNELLLLAVSGLFMLLGARFGGVSGRAGFAGTALPWPKVPWLAAAAPVPVATVTASPFGLLALFLFFLKVGSVLFGSGYVLFAFLHADLVQRWHWLTENQLLDSIAVGQITPGPLFTTATFIGYILGGPAAALLATLGIFLPAFAFVAVSGPLIPRLRQSRLAGAFLDGVVVGSLALMAVVTWHLGRASIVDWITASIAVLAGVLLVRYRFNSAWLVLGGAAAGLAALAAGWVS